MWSRTFQNTILPFLLVQLLPQIQTKEVVYNFNVRYFNGAPDGVTKPILGVNGQFPGPTIRATIGDLLTVRVTNSIQSGDGLSIHWHGLEQYFSPFQDGPEWVTQCPIAPNTTMTYQFILQQSGTYWWHSHHAYQYTEGCWGALIIDNKVEVHGRDYDEELTITLNDWYHIPGKILTDWFLSLAGAAGGGNAPIPNSAMINGVGRYDCAIARLQNHTCSSSIQRYPVFEVVRGKRYRVRVISAAAHATFNFSIDGHKLEAIEVDGVDTVKVAAVDKAVIAPAQRYSFIVDMSQSAIANQFWIRATVTGTFNFPNNINQYGEAFRKEILGILRYKEPADGDEIFSKRKPGPTLPVDQEDEKIIPEGRPATHSGIPPQIGINRKKREAPAGAVQPRSRQFDQKIQYEFLNSPDLPTTNPPSNPTVLNENSCQPSLNAQIRLAPPSVDQTITLNVDFKNNSKGEIRASFNDIVYKVGPKPALFQAINRKPIPRHNNPINTKYGPGKVVQLIINSRDRRGHPFHLHGHTFWVVGTGKSGDGDYNAIRDARKLTRDVVRRDTVAVPSRSWAVLRYFADNPGVWLFHCHINWHFQAGLGLLFVEGGPASVYRTFGTRPNTEGVEVCRKAGITYQ